MNELKFKNNIAGMRAIAIIFVVLYHYENSYFSGGYIGVDIFFVLSGYLITMVLARQSSVEGFMISDFYISRIRRLLPALLVMLFVTIPFAYYLIYPKESSVYLLTLTLAPLGLSNVLYYFKSGYFVAAADFRPLLHTWSLGLEFQFYFLYPIFYVWANKFDNKLKLIFLIVIYLIGFCLSYLLLRAHSQFSFYMLPSRGFEFIAGCLAFYLELYLRSSKFRLNIVIKEFIAIAGVLLIIIALFMSDGKTQIPGIYTFICVSGTLLYIVFSHSNRGVGFYLSNNFLVYVGLISYSLYLWHQPFIIFPRLAFNVEIPWIISSILLLFSIFVSILSFKYIEKPFKNTQFISNRYFFSALGLVYMLLFFITFSGHYLNGLPDRFDSEFIYKLNNYNSYPHGPLRNDNCTKLYPQFQSLSSCLINSIDDPDVLIIGDSHAHHYYKSITNKVNNKVILSLGSWSCFPAPSRSHLNRNDCESNFNNLLRFLNENKSIKYVVLSGYWAYLQSGGFGLKNGYYKLPAEFSISESSIFNDNLNILIKSMKSHEREVIFMMDVPDLNFNPISCIDFSPHLIGQRSPCIQRYEEYYNRNYKFLDSLKHDLISKNIDYIYDPVPLFCNQNECIASKNDVLLYFDSDHLSSYGADIVIDDLLRTVRIR